jgi:hypothetical protein
MRCGVTIPLGLIFIRNLNNLAEYIDLKISDGAEKYRFVKQSKFPLFPINKIIIQSHISSRIN